MLTYKEALQSGRIYCIKPDGIDTSERDGLSEEQAWRTLQWFYNSLVSTIDINGQNITAYLYPNYGGTGLNITKTFGTTYGSINIRPHPSVTTPIVFTEGISIGVKQPGALCVYGEGKFKFVTAGALGALDQSLIAFSGIEFGEGSTHIFAQNGGVVRCDGPYTISGGAMAHVNVSDKGKVEIRQTTRTFINSPNFSQAFALVDSYGRFVSYGMTEINNCTGLKAVVNGYGIVDTGTGSLNVLPGNSNGVIATNTDGSLLGLVR